MIRAHRENLARSLMARFDRTVRYGPFRGMRLLESSAWSPAAKAPMLLGLYERELLHEILTAPAHFDTFVDIGAADGYYCVGILFAGRFARSIAYEMSEAGRASVRDAAALNGVTDALEIRGAADGRFYEELAPDIRDRSVFLIDIEGGEFDILTRDAFRALARSVLFVELHDWVDPNGTRLAALKDNAAATHDVETIVHAGRDVYQFAELQEFREDDLWLICSEGRPHRMSWLKLSPKAS